MAQIVHFDQMSLTYPLSFFVFYEIRLLLIGKASDFAFLILALWNLAHSA
jgi:hypothetical protein